MFYFTAFSNCESHSHRVSPFRALALGLLLSAVGAACAGRAVAQPPDRPPPEKIFSDAPKPRLIGWVEYSDYSLTEANARELLQDEKYDELEQAVAECRKVDKVTPGRDRENDVTRSGKIIYSNGQSRLTAFYSGVTFISSDQPGSEQIALLKKWVAARPTSVTAQIALAECLVHYAWRARGTSYSSEVTKAGWKLLEERLQEARLVLRKAKILPEKCPHWYYVALQIALGQGWDEPLYESVFKEAIAFDATYYPLYFARSYHLLDRWYGEEGDPEAFARKASDAMAKLRGVKEGDLLYARIIWFLDRGRYHEIDFAEPTVSYIRLKSGFEEMKKQYPDNQAVISEWARLCTFTGSVKNLPERKSEAREAFKLVGNNADNWVWGNIPEFVEARDWALKD